MHIYSLFSLLFFSFLTVHSAFTSPESSAMPSLAWPRSSGWSCPQGQCPTHLIHDSCGCTRVHCVCCSFICSPPVPPIAMFSIQPASYLDSHPVLFLISLGIRGEKINPLYTCRFCRTFISSASSLWCLFLLLHLPPVGTVNTWVWYIFLHWYQTKVWVFFKLSLISSITKHWARKSTRAYPSD